MTTKKPQPRLAQPQYVLLSERTPPYGERVLVSVEPRPGCQMSWGKRQKYSNYVCFGTLSHTNYSGHYFDLELGHSFSSSMRVVAWRDVPEAYCAPADIARETVSDFEG